jgi:IS605 OrfB family transposase
MYEERADGIGDGAAGRESPCQEVVEGASLRDWSAGGQDAEVASCEAGLYWSQEVRSVIPGTIHCEDFTIIDQMMRDYSSCLRFAYNRLLKDGLEKKNDVVKACKPKYMAKLNQRYIQSAVAIALGLVKKHGQKPVVFGGRKLFTAMCLGKATKQEWQLARDGQLYCMGDTKGKHPNKNLHIVFNEQEEKFYLRVSLPEARKFLLTELYVPAKYLQELKRLYLSGNVYDIRLTRDLKDGNEIHRIAIGYEEAEPKVCFGFKDGAVGIDLNPSGVALVETDRNGNILHHHFISSHELIYASKTKRNNAVYRVAHEIDAYCQKVGKGLVVEDLKFGNRSGGASRQLNRVFSNFVHKKLALAIERTALRAAVELKKVNPAFTSIVGQLKYQSMLSLNRHTSAALVIARLGLVFKEVVRCAVREVVCRTKGKVATKFCLAGKNFEKTLTQKALGYFQKLYAIKMLPLTAACLESVCSNAKALRESVHKAQAAPEGVGEVNGLCSLAAVRNGSYLPMKSAMPILIGF